MFPNGKTLHVPSDGKPLPGYEQALASYKARKGAGTPNIELASAGDGKRKSGGLLAALFGGGADEADDVADVASDTPAPRPKTVQPKGGLPGIAIVAPDKAQRADVQVASEDEPVAEPAKDTPETIIAALPPRSVPLPAFAPRPKADVGVQTPETVPFGMADASAAPVEVAAAKPEAADPAAAAVTQEIVAGNIPLPTWRPEHSTPPDLAPKNQDSVLLALADTAQRGSQATGALAMLPSPRPDEAGNEARVIPAATHPDEIKAMLEKVSSDQYAVASLPAPRSAFDDPAGVDAASPRAALASRPAGSDPVSALGGVKTTRKEDRANARDVKPERRATIVAAAPKVARWALQGNEQIEQVSDSTTAPRLAFNLVRTAPSEVYTTGFQNADMVADAHRFTGTAVKFLSVARFQTK